MPATDGTPKRRMPAAKRREMILVVAREAFIESGEGVKGVSVKAIADRCGIDEALVYRHFGTKEELYFEAVAMPIEEVVARFAERVKGITATDAAMDPVEREWELTYQYFLWLFDMPPEILRMVGMLMFGESGRASAFYARTFAPALETLEQLVQGELPNWPHGDFSVPLSVRAVVATAFWLVVESDLTGRPLDHDRAAREMTDLLIYGMTERSSA